ncbi:hypothetical protein CcaverHIS002_0400340 [Cutaneotrichosporon cavernicola]|uniref:Uncharacterized protein n=1 Tax=Cutaneotrichosporon cavernicola TaxID=279322 RepID=A0AA48QVC1_9TREE|nr:uncharacterized protein CcaverHIS019_0400340 [Cutaneotrichosporon cavernicola]BEI83430.1 hypothetical protein CcaverHIS002_0400340 [Cutaneotrichosporon cavernicola]BEI91214.1 hypothetical protein CcaverHIS019_0400340 [Cutaneotrichosporon cavernicola]BEI98987.1 hypothetical protein CcaverHIS631_0400300 [Cutaneotrichosporon cavernicola]BEJ06761.1 hypothetical protein CcaverHIS641_0400300 [Cutaneotrichosporon cavernicola]
MPALTRAPRPLPASWKEVPHPPTLPVAYPSLLPLLTVSKGSLELALRTPMLSMPVLRARNEHLILAQRGDAYLRVVLLQIGAELGLTLSGRHHVVSAVGSNATLAHIALESGVLDAAFAQRKTGAPSVSYKAAAGIFEALVAVMEEEMGPRAAKILKIALFPWVAAVVDAKIVAVVETFEGVKAAAALKEKVARMMEVMASANVGCQGLNGTDGCMRVKTNGVNGVHSTKATICNGVKSSIAHRW